MKFQQAFLALRRASLGVRNFHSCTWVFHCLVPVLLWWVALDPDAREVVHG